MHGFLTFLLLICHLTVGLNGATIKTEDNNSEPIELTEKYVEQRRRLPIFPKNSMKFVVTPKPYIDSVYTHSPKEKIMKKIPVIARVTPRAKTTRDAMTPLISRKPLMKLRTFTIKSLANGRFKKIEKNPTHIPNRSQTQKNNNADASIMQFSEDFTTEVYFPEESRINVEKRPLLEKSDEKAPNNKQDRKVKEPVNIETKGDKFTSEEEQDRNEFIFLEKNNVKHTVNDLLDNGGQDFDQVLETTTEFIFPENELRVKRSKNIIEEENMASTVAGFKYTGRDTRLNQDLYFKNIHS